MDKEGANPDHVKGQLSEHGLVPEDWGGDTPMVPVSAHTGFGIDDILEIILLVAEMQELKANPDRAGVATVLESHLDQKLGPVATILMNAGQLAK
jgi:translation initiation factor IF-2